MIEDITKKKIESSNDDSNMVDSEMTLKQVLVNQNYNKVNTNNMMEDKGQQVKLLNHFCYGISMAGRLGRGSFFLNFPFQRLQDFENEFIVVHNKLHSFSLKNFSLTYKRQGMLYTFTLRISFNK